MRRAKRLCAALLAALALAGCSGGGFPGRNVEELLRAPQPSAQQSAVQAALNGYLGETLQLKYPRGGDEMAPFLFADFDGDGVGEAAVLYTTESKGQNVHLAVLEPGEDAWQVACEAEGLSTEAASVELVHMPAGGFQLVVGFANANLAEKYLVIYTYADGALHSDYQQAYEQYLAADLNGDGAVELALVPTPAQPGTPASLQLLLAREGKLAPVQTVELHEAIAKCTGLATTYYGKRRGLVVDGVLSAGGNTNEVLCLLDDRLYAWPMGRVDEVVAASTRTLQNLPASDLTGLGVVCVPVVTKSLRTEKSAGRLYFVEWHNYLAPDTLAQWGVFDATLGVFLRLPLSWRDAVSVSDGTLPDSWQLRETETDELLFTARTIAAGENSGNYIELARAGESRMVAFFAENCPAADAALITRGVRVLPG